MSDIRAFHTEDLRGTIICPRDLTTYRFKYNENGTLLTNYMLRLNLPMHHITSGLYNSLRNHFYLNIKSHP